VNYLPRREDAAVNYSIYLHLALATLPEAGQTPPPADPRDVIAPALDSLLGLVEAFRLGGPTQAAAAQFEHDLQGKLRELGRVLTQCAYNSLEPAAVADCPQRVTYQGSSYHRLTRKTPKKLSTLFGTVTVYRLGYRAGLHDGEPVLFPLMVELGVAHGASAALMGRVGRYLAETGATQNQVLARLHEEHGLSWGVKRLRQAAEFMARALERHRGEAQADAVLGWLAEAQQSRGRHRPVLAAGRDGITLGLRLKGFQIREVATAGTLSVYDRRGNRLGTVYLASVPQPGQPEMTANLTSLLTEVLRRWEGPMPRMCYVTDCGDNETAYYRGVLRRMTHPRTGEALSWQWVVDYYHASQRISTMAEALFGACPRANRWVRKMRRLLLKKGGVRRLLLSAAALRGMASLGKKRASDFQKAYDYLRSRTKHMRYDQYRRVGMPIGSGVTEAACKTIFTQRLKLSGMRWKKAGARTILALRVVLLSGVWEATYARVLGEARGVKVEAYALPDRFTSRIAG
jgi:hypothetical protein